MRVILKYSIFEYINLELQATWISKYHTLSRKEKNRICLRNMPFLLPKERARLTDGTLYTLRSWHNQKNFHSVGAWLNVFSWPFLRLDKKPLSLISEVQPILPLLSPNIFFHKHFSKFVKMLYLCVSAIKKCQTRDQYLKKFRKKNFENLFRIIREKSILESSHMLPDTTFSGRLRFLDSLG